MFEFAETTKSMNAVEILNYYRNLYYAEPQVTERGIVANAINDVLPNMEEVVRCKDCKYRGDYLCPMYFEEYIEWDDDGYHECDLVEHDRTSDDGFCDMGERRTDEYE